MVSALISKVLMLVFGTLYPAYRSYKAIKNKDVREYVKWMMYWIVYALFVTTEVFADTFLSWLPLYYEIKCLFLLWLLSPATKGSRILYRKFVHPRLVKHEKAIDKYIAEARKNSIAAFMHLGKRGMDMASDTLVKTAATGQIQLIETLRRYGSMQDLRSADVVDAASVRNSWHGSTLAEQQFDPENDVDMLQRQYKPSYNEQPSYIEEENEPEPSDDSLSSRSGLTLERSQSIRTKSPLKDTEFTSYTLPRARKSRKTLQGVFPDARTTRSSRQLKNTRMNTVD